MWSPRFTSDERVERRNASHTTTIRLEERFPENTICALSLSLDLSRLAFDQLTTADCRRFRVRSTRSPFTLMT